MNETLALTIWEEARRLLVRQEADLDTLRARAVTVLSAGAVVAGLFAGRLPKHWSGLATVAVSVGAVSFVAVAAIVVGKLLSPRDFTFSSSFTSWIDDLRNNRDVAVAEWAYNKVRDFNGQRANNQPVIDSMYDAFRWVCALLLVEVVALLVAVL